MSNYGFEHIISETEARALLQRYEEPHRYYHGLEHLNFLFKRLNAFKRACGDEFLSADQKTAAGLICLYHDAVYKVDGSKDSEELSAKLFAESEAAKGLSPFVRGVVIEGILATAEHHRTQEGLLFEQELFLDCDLSGMGDSYGQFVDNGDDIGQEYAHVPEDVFNANRAAFFKKLLARPSIYYTDWARANFESNTRRNIERYLERAV